MTIYVKSGGSWRRVQDGKMFYLRQAPAPDGSNGWTGGFKRAFFAQPTKVSVLHNGVWADTGYVLPVGTPTNLAVKSWTGFTGVTFSWSAASNGEIPDKYALHLLNSSGSTVTTVEVNGSTLEATVSVSPGTNYSAYVVAVRGNISSVPTPLLKIRVGNPAVTHEELVYGWSEEKTMLALPEGDTSIYLPDYSNAKAHDNDIWTAWISGPRTTSTGSGTHTVWEGISFNLPASKRLLTKIVYIAPVEHTTYLGIKTTAWLGSITATSIGIASSGYPNGNDPEYARILNHNYVAVNADHTTNVRQFNLEPMGLEFSAITNLTMSVTNLLALYGAWRARINEVSIRYKDWVTKGTVTVVDQPAVENASGPTAW